jgi:mRNA interferase YafO
MATFCTNALENHLSDLGEQATAWATYFDSWACSPEVERDKNYFFGKDSAYVNPLVGGKPYLLRHVHIVPISDIDALKLWDKAHDRNGRKTSDRALVYTHDNNGNYLLIFVLDEPSAHSVASMRTQQDRETMEGFAAVADAFIFDGSILA